MIGSMPMPGVLQVLSMAAPAFASCAAAAQAGLIVDDRHVADAAARGARH
jgi:hypothetical protein